MYSCMMLCTHIFTYTHSMVCVCNRKERLFQNDTDSKSLYVCVRCMCEYANNLTVRQRETNILNGMFVDTLKLTLTHTGLGLRTLMH